MLWKVVLTVVISMSFLSNLSAQSGSLCYSPIIGPGTAVEPVGGTLLDLNLSAGNGAENIINGDLSDYAEISSLLSLGGSQGLAVTSSATYPAGDYAGFVVSLDDGGLVTLDVLAGITVETYYQGTLAETHTFNDGVAGASVVATGSPGKFYLSFKTTAQFDEVRLTKGTLANLSLSSTALRVYYAMAFDADCGTVDPNTNCYDQIAGNQTIVNFNSGTLAALSSLSDPENITDGDKDTYASLSLPAGTGLLGTSQPFVGVKSLQTIYPAGHRAGFMIQEDNGLLSADLIGALSIQTYLHGELQDDVALNAGGASTLLGASVLGGTDPIQEASIETTLPFNEVRLVYTGTLAASLGTLRIFYAFEGPNTCTDCKEALTTTASQPYTGELVSRDRDPLDPTLIPPDLHIYNTTGTYGVSIGSLSNTANLVDADLTNHADFDVVLSVLGAGARMTVKRTGGTDYPAGTVAGFALGTGSSLLSAGVLSGITIRLYKDDGQNPVQTISGASLVSAQLIASASDINFVGGVSTVDFDEIELDINTGLLSVGLPLNFDIYYAYVQLDTDNDGIPDCIDYCAGDDSVDSDGDGTPDDCDTCNEVNAKSATVDTDGDGILNACDTDSDNDGIPDVVEDTNGNGDPNDDDADGDGIPNYLDLDSDNDGILDLYEAGFSESDLTTNDASTQNGVLDSANPISTATPADSDGDGVPDYLDLDSDNDGIFDLEESGISGLTDANKDGVVDGPDADGDGVQDSADGDDAAFGSPGAGLASDLDGDGVEDFRDLDSDNDSINDIIESGRSVTDANNDGVVDGPDTDGDGIQDSADTDDGIFGSPAATDLTNSDNDPNPDYKDLDSDNDSYSDLYESGTTGYTDADDDGVVDGPDSDGDGIMDSVDELNGFGDANVANPTNTDGTDEPDYRDTDKDNDGTNDIEDKGNGGLDGNDDGMIDDATDTDGDGIAQVVDEKPTEFGGLGAGAPNLISNIYSAGANYNAGDERMAVISIFNKGNEVANAPLQFYISLIDATFELTADANLSGSVDAGFPFTVDNTIWDISVSGSRLYFTLKSGNSIPVSTDLKIGLKAKAVGTPSSNAQIRVVIVSGTAGETPDTDNVSNYYLSINL
ncbi:hypothetical protein LAG90_09855 [Marinilongibacter aquaticus]|uniref:hypothetical protein n=1 Tax=Marinilongibacter aquaticus TaxID=2975157 RepID=UPI0021BDE8DC|nr:hypothetical protein [Marinilongibacter aquaticus]UBM60937.1 hypothetical protein LAG90_09855 [Marinilongibacter aquaticus]